MAWTQSLSNTPAQLHVKAHSKVAATTPPPPHTHTCPTHSKHNPPYSLRAAYATIPPSQAFSRDLMTMPPPPHTHTTTLQNTRLTLQPKGSTLS
jgi:hypothetical protein